MFLYHGEADDMINVQNTTQSYKPFEDLYGDKDHFSFKTESGLPHSLSLKEINLFRDWTKKYMNEHRHKL